MPKSDNLSLMTIGLFTFDGPMYKDCNGVYCNTTITNEMFERYFSVVDKLYVVIRTFKLDGTYQELNLNKVETGECLRIIEMPNINSPKGLIFKKKSEKLIERYIKEADLIFLRIPSVLSDMAARLCIKFGKKYLVEVGGCSWDSYSNHGLLGKLIAPYMFFSQKHTVRNASYATYVTNRWLQNRYPTNAESISASNVYLKEFNIQKIQERIERYKKHNPSIYRIGTIASYDVRYKGQEYIIQAIARLKKRGIIIEYDLVGAGDPTFLSALAKKSNVDNQIHFVGRLVHDKIWEWLDTIDIYAQPSKQEGLPRAVIEAMNRGCLAIGSDVAGIPELLEDDMIFQKGNIQEISNVILKLLNEPNHEKRIWRNFNKSRDFEISLLQQSRQKIFNHYLNAILNEKR